MTKEQLLKENAELKARIKELDLPYREVKENKLYWLEFGISKLVFTEYDPLVDCLIEFLEQDSQAEIVLWELSRTEEQMKAGDMRIKLPEILAAGIERGKSKRDARQIRELLSYKLEIPKISSIVGVDEKIVKEIQKAIKDE